MTYDKPALALYKQMVEERHLIWERRQLGDPGPWTKDPVLANRKFTNMFRVLDPGSQFVFGLNAPDPIDVIARLLFYRITNLPKTWYAMRRELGRYPLAVDFTDDLTVTLKTYRDAGNTVFSGAYIIIPEPGTRNDKVEGVVRVVQHFLREGAKPFLDAETQEARFAALTSTPGIGNFLAMQVIKDWGYLQPEEPDLSFIVAGPGTTRGAELLNPDKTAVQVIYDLTLQWEDNPIVQLQDMPLTVPDVSNTLCEFSKYAKEVVNPRKTTPYKPAHPGGQSIPVLPLWW